MMGSVRLGSGGTWGRPSRAQARRAGVARRVATGWTAGFPMLGLPATGLMLVLLLLAAPQTSYAAGIRTSPSNAIPACITPTRLMAFVGQQNRRMDKRYLKIAQHYKTHGEKWRVRWDFAFFQMLVETNYLRFRRPDGSRADVGANQNNFAGIGATGNGVPGNSFPTVSIGVLAHIQHLVVYSGERIKSPVAVRTRRLQSAILKGTATIARRRAVTFQDLAGRWASDKKYGRTIAAVARRFHRSGLCKKSERATKPIARAEQTRQLAAPRPKLVRPPVLENRRPALAKPPTRVRPTLAPSESETTTETAVHDTPPLPVRAARISAPVKRPDKTELIPEPKQTAPLVAPPTLARRPAPEPATPISPSSAPAALRFGAPMADANRAPAPSRWAVPALRSKPATKK